MESIQKPVILEMRKVSKAFERPPAKPLTALEGIDLSISEGEILGLLGRSGSGKSTLLRIGGGLMPPSSGVVLFQGKPLTGPADGMAIVFQTFALMPWLTVLENVELGLDAMGVSREEARRRSLAAIDLIGLSGFQSAYPRELSGGMRQRVGFARATVIQPLVLLMDEPFSALDVLTAETLRTDFLDLYMEHQLSTKAVLLVTHNIEEAVQMCDRILVLSSGPGRIEAEINVTLPHPRNRLDAAFHDIVDEFYSILTSRVAESLKAERKLHGGLALALPAVGSPLIVAFIEALAAKPYEGQAEFTDLVHSSFLGLKHPLGVAEALHILEFAELQENKVKLTAAGQVFAQSSPEDRLKIFKEHLLRFVPLTAHICRILEEREGHEAPRRRFELEFEDHLSQSDAERTLQTVIAWGRYAEIFVYDDRKRIFSLHHQA